MSGKYKFLLCFPVLNPGVKTGHEVEGSKKNNVKISDKAHEIKAFHELTKHLEKQILLGVIKHNPCITNC